MIQVQVTGMKELQKKLSRENFAKIQSSVLKKGSAIIVEESVREAPADTGMLRRSINARIGNESAWISVNNGGRDLNYAEYVHEGTGIYGPKKQMIVAKNKKFLAWNKNGKWIFAKKVKGTKPNRFFERAGKNVEKKIQNIAQKEISKF